MPFRASKIASAALIVPFDSPNLLHAHAQPARLSPPLPLGNSAAGAGTVQLIFAAAVSKQEEGPPIAGDSRSTATPVTKSRGMGTLDALVAQIQALSSESDLAGLQSALRTQQQDNVMRQSAAGLLTAVANLDPAAHSLGCLLLL